jgi:4-amino-4-deoxy-L-arabinose transferase-like glycosyltransferase
MVEGKPIAASWKAWLLLWLVAAALFALRLSAPADLESHAQHRNVGYVMDAVCNGHWVAQYDLYGRVTSKPPLHTWLAAFFARLFGAVNPFTLVLPSALAVLALACVIHAAGRQYFGARAGLFAALMFLASAFTVKQIVLVRTDALFALWITVAALLAFRAWTGGANWTGFWLASAASTLTKGPLGVVLAASGLLAVLWQKGAGQPLPVRGSHWRGLALFALVTVGWFVLAWHQFGRELVDKMIFQELLGQAVGTHKASAPGSNVHLAPLYFLSRFAPWSILAGIAFWRLCRTPAPGQTERLFERFLFCWFFAGLLIFSLAAHHRPDLLFPLIPAAALLAGREMSRLTEQWKPASIRWATVAGAAVAVALVFANFHLLPPKRAKIAALSSEVKELALTLGDWLEDGFELLHVDTPVTLQMYLQQYTPRISFAEAVEKLHSADPILIAVMNVAELERHFEETSVFDLFEWPLGGKRRIHIVSNRSNLWQKATQPGEHQM